MVEAHTADIIMTSSFNFGPEAERRYHLISGKQLINVVPLEESFESIRQHILSVEQANKGLREGLETLRDEKWKDKELQHWKEVAENALAELHRGFGIDQKEADAIRAWKKEHEKEFHNGSSYRGAIGGGYTYEFVPTSIGTIGTIKCSCGEKYCFRELE